MVNPLNYILKYVLFHFLQGSFFTTSDEKSACFKRMPGRHVNGLNPFELSKIESEKRCLFLCAATEKCLAGVYERNGKKRYCRMYNVKPQRVFLSGQPNQYNKNFNNISIKLSLQKFTYFEKSIDCIDLIDHRESFTTKTKKRKEAETEEQKDIPLRSALRIVHRQKDDQSDDDLNLFQKLGEEFVQVRKIPSPPQFQLAIQSPANLKEPELDPSEDLLPNKNLAVTLPTDVVFNEDTTISLTTWVSMVNSPHDTQGETHVGQSATSFNQGTQTSKLLITAADTTPVNLTSVKPQGIPVLATTHSVPIVGQTFDGGPPSFGPTTGGSVIPSSTPDVGTVTSYDILPTTLGGYGTTIASGYNAKTTAPLPQSTWSLWSEWNPACSRCGGNRQQRSRTCVVYSACATGESTETRNCAAASSGYGCVILATLQQYNAVTQTSIPVIQQGSWSEWASWSLCSDSCGVGTVTRSRTCLSGTTSNCVGDVLQTTDCPSLQPCCSDWSQWTQCSQTCGTGQQTRTRNCGLSGSAAYNNGNSLTSANVVTDLQICNTKTCTSTYTSAATAYWSAWDPWNECSQTCGSGSRQRSRLCSDGNNCVGQSVEITTCNTEPCVTAQASWSEWGLWSSCSQSCGAGTQQRTRTCTEATGCQGEAVEMTACTAAQCLIGWSEWGAYGDCTVTCGKGVQIRRRTCAEGRSCVGQAEDIQPCTAIEADCPTWLEWGAWGICSTSCGNTGLITRQRSCTRIGQCNGPARNTQPCTQQTPCSDWLNWSSWSSCSATCGSAGTQTRTRSCSTTSQCVGVASESQQYGLANGDNTEQTDPCSSTVSCMTVWGEWQSWSACTQTCQSAVGGGTGSQVRTRSCLSSGHCDGQDTMSQACGTNPCPTVGAAWSEWAPWSACSQTCQSSAAYTGIAGSPTATGAIVTRTRTCLTGTESQCFGVSVDTQPCAALAACSTTAAAQWNTWSPWSSCSVTCGPGVQTRERNCQGVGCVGSASDLQQCNSAQQCEAATGYYKQQFQSFYKDRAASSG